jgi:capsular polysaccharide biosynthesis protein
MDLRRDLGSLRRWILLIILSTALAAGVGYVVTRSISPVYQASARLFVIAAQPTSPLLNTPDDLASGELLTRGYADLVKTRPVLAEAAQSLGLPPNDRTLDEIVTVRVVGDTSLIQISAEDTDPRVAREAANAVAAALIR